MKPAWLTAVLLTAICLLSGAPEAGAQNETTTGFSQEYFVRQKPDEALLIRIDSFEAEFESRVFAPDQQLLSKSGVAGNTLAPIFHFIGTDAKERQLDIDVMSVFFTNRSRFDLGLNRLMVTDDRSAKLAQAYQYLAHGLEEAGADTAANWSIKANSLMTAAGLFEDFGMEELRLWSLYYAAWFMHYELGDQNMVLDFTDQILTSVQLMRLRKLELAALQLQSAALASQREAGSLPPPPSGPDPVQAMLERTASLAASMGLQLERAMALQASGQDFANRSLYPQALERFESALGIADALEAGDLSTAIRERIVEIHDTHGDVMASGEVLQAIESQLAGAGAIDELAENLLAQGRLFNQTYRFPEAIDVLEQALRHERNSVTRSQANLELGIAHFHSGRADLALEHSRAAVINPQSGEYRRRNPVIEVGAGLRIMAGAHRVRGEYQDMRRARQAQQAYLDASDRPAWLYEQGLDLLAAGDRSRATQQFRQAMQLASGDNQAHWGHLSRLQICALNAAQDSCSAARIRQAHDALISGGIPVAGVEASRLLSRIQLAGGRPSEAAATLDTLMDEVYFLRRLLPGVLGAWYWQNRETLFSAYVDLLGRLARSETDGFRLLLGLSKAREIENTAGRERIPRAPGNGLDVDAMRVLLAHRADPGSDGRIVDLNQRINQQLAGEREGFAYLTEQVLRNWLDSLGPAEGLLTFHVEAGSALALIGQRGQVRRIRLSGPGGLATLLADARERMAVLDGAGFDSLMEQLGTRLIAPLERHLPDRIFFVPAGPMLGIPVAAIRSQGQYLVEGHSVLNLVAFPRHQDPGPHAWRATPERVFLAGGPRDYTGDYLTRLETSREIQAVRDVFVGPGLTIVQGSALLMDEFNEERFRDAELVHLAMPGYIDLRTPANSSLELSEPGRDQGRGRLGGASIRAWNLRSPGLVFMSATRLGGEPLSAFDGRLGLVMDVLESGAGAAVATSWSSQSEESVSFIGDYYGALVDTQEPASTLAATQRDYLARPGRTNPQDWARFQLFIR